jgi:DNA end-binding protein Ku
MARAIWKGSISFGLVNIPVGLYSAESRDEVHFTLLDRRNMAPIHYKRVNEKNGREVPWAETVRGYEFEEGHYVVVSDDDLKRASPEATQTVEIVDFVDLDDISPVYFDKPYYLAPAKKGEKSYALLRETLKRTGKVGIAKVVIRTKQYLAAVIARGDVIVLDLLRFGHEVRDPAELDLPAGKQGVSEKELEMAERLVQGMVDKWKPDRYRDDYRSDLMKMIHARVKAGQFEASPEPPPEAERPARGQVIDLMTLLKQSVDEGGSRQAAKPARATAKPAKAAKTARKPAARKPARRAAKRPAARKRKTA